MFRVPGALHRDPRDSIVDVADILGRKVHGRRADVLSLPGDAVSTTGARLFRVTISTTQAADSQRRPSPCRLTRCVTGADLSRVSPDRLKPCFDLGAARFQERRERAFFSARFLLAVRG